LSGVPDLSRTFSDRVFLLLLVVGLALRLGAGFATADRLFAGDEGVYEKMSRLLAEDGKLESGDFVRPPLYIVMLGGVRLLPLPFWPTYMVLQCLASAAVMIPVYRTARRIGGRRAARFATGFVALNPALIGYAHLLWPETVYLLGVSLLGDGVSTLRPGGRARAVGLGILSGLCMLMKPVWGPFSLILALWWWRRFGLAPALRLALPYGLAAALVIAPWAVVNQLRHGGTVLLENQAAYNLWVGNDPRPAVSVVWEYILIPGQAERSRQGFRRGIELIAADPGGFALRAQRRAINLWGGEYFVLRIAAFGSYGDLSKPALLAIFWALQLAHIVTLLFAAVGFARAPRDTILGPWLVYGALFTVLAAAMVATTRFVVPFAYPLAIAAGLGAVAWPRGWRERRSLAALAAVVLVLAISASRPVFRPFLTGGFDTSKELRHPDWFWFRY
jgi:4-amino-4-deoxy-L-arabinose transferase-like glycosyltransferase